MCFTPLLKGVKQPDPQQSQVEVPAVVSETVDLRDASCLLWVLDSWAVVQSLPLSLTHTQSTKPQQTVIFSGFLLLLHPLSKVQPSLDQQKPETWLGIVALCFNKDDECHVQLLLLYTFVSVSAAAGVSGEGTRWLQSTDLAIAKHFCHLAGQPRRHSLENVDMSIGPVKINLLNFGFSLKGDNYGI